MRLVEHVARLEADRNAFKILTGKVTRKRSLGKLRRRWEDNIRNDLKEMSVNWIDSVQYRDYWRVLVEDHKSWKFWFIT